MKSALSLALAICLAASELSAAAYEQVGDEVMTSGVDADHQSDTIAQSDWTSVHKIAPGTGIIVSIKEGSPGERYLVETDDSHLTVLNLTAPTLPRGAVRTLQDLVTQHADYLASISKSGQLVDGDLRVGRDGVFVANHKVADLGDVVEKIARQDVVEVATRQRGLGFWGRLGTLGGYFVGAMTGGFVAGSACQAAYGRNGCDTGAVLVGSLAGGIAGAVHGFREANRVTEAVVYQAP